MHRETAQRIREYIALPQSPNVSDAQVKAAITPVAVGVRLRRWWASKAAPEAAPEATPQAIGVAFEVVSARMRRRLGRWDCADHPRCRQASFVVL
jgi:hypothetical protein